MDFRGNGIRGLSSTLLLLSAAMACTSQPIRSQGTQPVVLFDEGHGQHFLIDGMGMLHLSSLAEVLRNQGFEVHSTGEPLLSETLQKVDSLVISGAFQPLREEEIAAIRSFLQSGGRMAVMLHIGPPVAKLLHQLGVAISNGVIREEIEMVDQPINFRVTNLEPHPITHGLEGFNIYGGWALLPIAKPARSLAQSSGNAWVDLNRDGRLDEGDATQSFSVLVVGTEGDGHFLVFADDAMFQNQFLHGENLELSKNLSRWLVVERDRLPD